jgi:XTP/dITP diphosphohydrolase
MKLCFATNNTHKIKEIEHKLEGLDIVLCSLKDIGCTQELPENQKTLGGNSLEKAEFVYNQFGVDCFADDTGLEVFALDGEPGVYSARYAGDSKNPEANMDLLLQNMKGVKDRRAQFRTVITLIINGKKKQFEGVVHGRILEEKRGGHGFGYDHIFQPNHYDETIAQMPLVEKNKISHRAIALEKLVNQLKSIA